MQIKKQRMLAMKDGTTVRIPSEAQEAPEALHLAFDSGVNIDVDLSKVRMSRQQREAIDKLLKHAPKIKQAECVGDSCPAQKFLTPKEFESVRGLKATLGAGGGVAAPGPIVDFCLHVIIVGRERVGQRAKTTRKRVR